MKNPIREIDYSNYFWQDDKVRLRAIQPEDWEGDYISNFDTPARRFLECTIELPPTIAGSKKFTEENADFTSTNGRIMFTIENLECKSIGGINLNSIDERNGTFSIGIVIDKEYRGSGYGTSAMKILLKYAFLERRLNKFNDYVLEGNEGSAKMMKKLGCVQEGVRRQVVYLNGQYLDFILYGLTKDEFIEKQKRSN
ncbi:GNAT family N-acetyltransferase [Lederbergia lenta]|uniref:Acetyltransferase n=1 Tax=Lederbergia lenta TaxID=1467 RepID=A0A2X4YNL1_LEDLE|nr:GNAT family protein [Lederbergia lenta]MCM3113148.1 GNAT family N-acetyltransferase [Lederbergia lenta]MEC2326063.1 GNAT family protein [Lederbergia lenta]SQI53295.1 acetyltransferase [Lederbergia lenta]